MAEDRSKQILTVYKGATKVTAGKAGELSVAITGLAAGTVVALGDYKVTFSLNGAESAKVDVPAFTVPTPPPAIPATVKSVATADGANITAE